VDHCSNGTKPPLAVIWAGTVSRDIYPASQATGTILALGSYPPDTRFGSPDEGSSLI